MKIDGIIEIDTDAKNKTCTFRVKPGVDYETVVKELAADKRSKLFECKIQ